MNALDESRRRFRIVVVALGGLTLCAVALVILGMLTLLRFASVQNEHVRRSECLSRAYVDFFDDAAVLLDDTARPGEVARARADLPTVRERFARIRTGDQCPPVDLKVGLLP